MTTMTPEPGSVTGGADTHLDVHVAAAVDHLGGMLGTKPESVDAVVWVSAWERGKCLLYRENLDC